MACTLALPAAAQLKSPNARYEIVYTESGAYMANIEFKDTLSGEVIHGSLSSDYQDLKCLDVAWSKDS